MASRPVRWGFKAALMLFALRFVVGWHFFSAGLEKLKNPKFRSSYFLEQAVGPFASYFHGMVPDALGEKRLDLDARRQSWTDFKDALLSRVGESEEKSQSAEEVLETHLEKFDYFVAQNGPDIEQHLNEVERYANAVDDPNLAGVDFGRDWLKGKRAELKYAAQGWTQDLKLLENNYRDALVSAVEVDPKTVEQAYDPTEKNWVDHSVTWMTLIVGALLLLGFLTPLAALVGAGFLLTVMLTQPFWAPDADLTYFPYQLVEFVALLFIAVVGAGRAGGLDFFFGRGSRKSDAELI